MKYDVLNGYLSIDDEILQEYRKQLDGLVIGETGYIEWESSYKGIDVGLRGTCHMLGVYINGERVNVNGMEMAWSIDLLLDSINLLSRGFYDDKS